jgi:pimeloyl-ACP methyl ester carboxylesterase
VIPTIFAAARAGHTAPRRVVMLPAAYSGPDDFVREGFVSTARERHLDVDLVFAGVELQQVIDRTVLTRVRQELILPARSLGCAVWLGGISLGGYLALCCAEQHPAELAGLCVFAPYLGSHIVTGEIARARGVEGWDPPELANDDDERRVWRFIKSLRSGALTVHLGLGSEDRFAERHRLLAAALAPTDVDSVPGGHDWPTWRRLWERFLDIRLAPHPEHDIPRGISPNRGRIFR